MQSWKEYVIPSLFPEFMLIQRYDIARPSLKGSDRISCPSSTYSRVPKKLEANYYIDIGHHAINDL